MKVYRVIQKTNYAMGYLRYGHREGFIEANSKKEALEKLNACGGTDDLEFVLDDYELSDADYEGQPFELYEVNEI